MRICPFYYILFITAKYKNIININKTLTKTMNAKVIIGSITKNC